jgi:hypothetical protein
MDKRAAAAFAQARDVRVIVNQPCGFDIVESALNQIGSLRADPALQFFRLMCKCPADMMNQAHSWRSLSALARRITEKRPDRFSWRPGRKRLG